MFFCTYRGRRRRGRDEVGGGWRVEGVDGHPCGSQPGGLTRTALRSATSEEKNRRPTDRGNLSFLCFSLHPSIIISFQCCSAILREIERCWSPRSAREAETLARVFSVRARVCVWAHVFLTHSEVRQAWKRWDGDGDAGVRVQSALRALRHTRSAPAEPKGYITMLNVNMLINK